MVNLRPNPETVKSLSQARRHDYEVANIAAVGKLRTIGYNVVDVGSDFSQDDYIDSGHLVASGGRRMAQKIADAINGLRK